MAFAFGVLALARTVNQTTSHTTTHTRHAQARTHANAPDKLRGHGVLGDVDEGVRGQHAAELVAGVVDDGVLAQLPPVCVRGLGLGVWWVGLGLG